MEAIFVLLIIAIIFVPIILLVWVKTSISTKIDIVDNKVNHLNNKLDQSLKNQEKPKVKVEEEAEEMGSFMVSDPIVTSGVIKDEQKDIVLSGEEEKPVEKKEPEKVEEEIADTKEKVEEIKEKPLAENVTYKAAYSAPEPKKKVEPKVVLKKTKKKRDVEKFIGENLINKIGIGVLLLGISYFLKYAIDNNWISEIGRFAIGILSGGILTFIAHKIRTKYKAFSSVLVGGGLATFYFTIGYGFHVYELFSQTVAFSLMVGVTIFSVLLSISYDKKELAVLALVGGFLTPLMVSNGSGNYIVLFTYIAIINAGMMVLAYFKKWNLINILSFAFTVGMYGFWFFRDIVLAANPPYAGALVFASIFYLMFFIMNIINNVKEGRKFTALDFSLLLSNSGLYYGVGMMIFLFSDKTQYQGIFTLIMAVFNFAFAFPLYRRKQIDKNLIFLLIGLVLTFISLTAPVQLSENYITLFWTAEMILLLWLGQKSKIKLMKVGSLIIMGLMMISLVWDWAELYSFYRYAEGTLPVIANRAFLTGAFSMIGMLLYGMLLRKEETNEFLPSIGVKGLLIASRVAFTSILYIGGVLELNYQLMERVNYGDLRTIAIATYNLVFLIGLTVYARKVQSKVLNTGITFTSVIALFLFPILNVVVREIRWDYIAGNAHIGSFAVQYLNLGMIIALGWFFINQIRTTYGIRSATGQVAVWGISVLGLIIASQQLDHAVLILSDATTENMRYLARQSIKSVILSFGE